MGLIAEPIFFESLRAGSGAKRKLINITNSEDTAVVSKVSEIEKPEWVELEGVHPGVELKIKAKGKLPVIANLNTNHKFFPKDSCRNQKIRINLADETSVEMVVTIPKIMPHFDLFRGVFAFDLGTSNSCYAYRGGAAERGAGGGGGGTQASTEKPTLIFFHDISDKRNPKFSIAREAEFDIKENSGQTYSYCLSIKRTLGQARSFYIMDRLAALGKEHHREYSSEQIAAFIVRGLIEQAQEEISGRISNVVATYPPMFSEDRKEAIRETFSLAFEDLGVDISPDEDIVMNLDEANAAAFNYIYGTMLDKFRRFNIDKEECQLLSFDFGGGTTDISLVHVRITRNPDTGRIGIETELKGLSGDANYGGDNVTLDMFRILKRSLALKIAEVRQEEFSGVAQEAGAETKKADGDDPWGSMGEDEGGGDDAWGGMDMGGGESDEDDPWGDSTGGDQDKEKQTAEEEEEEDPELVGVERPEDVTDDIYLDALKAVWDEREVIETTIHVNTSIYDATVEKQKADGNYIGQSQAKEYADEIERALETVLPTQYGVYADRNPHLESVAQKIFHELWQEANAIKVRVSNNETGKDQLTGTLKKAAKYSGVDPIKFNELSFEMKDLEAQIEGSVVANLEKAHNLYKNAGVVSVEGGITIGGPSGEQPELRVLLFGNSSRLPLVRRKALEVFGIDEQYLVMDRDLLKSAVARGACEEQVLRKAFGTRGGLIEYDPTGFLNRIPYTVGLMNPELGLMGFEKGFCPVFPRGTKIGKVKILTEQFFLIQDEMTELEMYADYGDGSEPQFLGWFDIMQPTPEDEIPKRASEEERDVEVQDTKPKKATPAAADSSETTAPAPAGGGGLGLGGGGGGLSLGGEGGGGGGGGGLALGEGGGDAAAVGGLALGEGIGDAAATGAQPPAEVERPEGFCIEVEILPSRHLLATIVASGHSKDGEKFVLKVDQGKIPPERDPFSGTH